MRTNESLIRRCKRRSLRVAVQRGRAVGKFVSFAAASGAHCGRMPPKSPRTSQAVSFAAASGAHCGIRRRSNLVGSITVSFAAASGAHCGNMTADLGSIAEQVSFAATSGAHCGDKSVVSRLVKKGSHSPRPAALIAGKPASEKTPQASRLIRRCKRRSLRDDRI